MSMSRMKKWILILGGLILLAFPILIQAADNKLNDDLFIIFDGLHGRGDECREIAVCTGTTDCYKGLDKDGNPYTEDTGEVGVSLYTSYDKYVTMAGSLQPNFDHGASENCERKVQTYTVIDRSGMAYPGLTNTMIGLKLSDLCSPGKTDCMWSTQFAGPDLPADRDIDELTLEEKMKIPISFPDTLDAKMTVLTNSPSATVIVSRYLAEFEDKPGVPIEGDYVMVSQYVYKPDDEPYFDITWKLETLRGSYSSVKFWHAMDTFTAGNDFGYGYLCDVTQIAGGTGGANFFQGTIALHPSAKQYEGWWAKNFQNVKNDELPDIDWSRPLAVSISDPSGKVAPLTSLEDNGIAQEWDELEVGTEPIYVSTRWTFDDPILQSSFGTTRSLFVVSSDDKIFTKSDGTKIELEPSIYDIQFNPRKWRGAVKSYKMPKSCTETVECQKDGSSDLCLESPECTGTAGCPKYCAVGYCAADFTCPSGQHCLFGFCTTKLKWETEAIDGTEDQRNIFTFDTSGTRYWFDDSNASALRSQLGVSTDAEARNLMNWFKGSLNGATDSTVDAEKVIIDENGSHDYDMHNPLNKDALAAGTTLRLLRERYDDTEANRWTLGDVTHADPVYIGAHPTNSWKDISDVDDEAYSDYFNKPDYQERQPVVLVAANDGMLHCYDSETGDELWAFVPWDVLPKISELASPFYEQLRTPMMDLRPVVQDMYDPTSRTWKTILIAGSRGGGDHYWAMDISPPSGHLAPIPPEQKNNPEAAPQSALSFMWCFTDDDLGLTYSIPTSGRFKTADAATPGDVAPSKWLVFLGSGYARHSAEQMQKQGYFYVLDMFSTSVVTDPVTGVNSTMPDTIAKIRISKDDSSMYGLDNDETDVTNNALSSATVADYGDPDVPNSAPDGYEDVVYIGDLVGHLLRFTIKEPVAAKADVVGQVLFSTFKSPEDDSSNPGNKREGVLDDFKFSVVNRRDDYSIADFSYQNYEFYKYPRPITTRPVVWRTTEPDDTTTDFLGSSSNRNKIMVFFGTGKYDAFYDSFDEYKREPFNASCQSWVTGSGYAEACIRDYQEMYGVIDYQEEGDDKRVLFSQLVHNEVDDGTTDTNTLRSITQNDDPTGSAGGGGAWRGWRLSFNSTRFDNRGEKGITEPVIWEQENMYRSQSETRKREWIAFFTTFTPNMQGTCDVRQINNAEETGGGYLMTVSAEHGGNPSFAIQDVTGDSLLGSNDVISATGEGYAGQKFAGSILSRVDVDPYQKVLYVKTGPDNPIFRVQIAGLPYLKGANTSIYRVE